MTVFPPKHRPRSPSGSRVIGMVNRVIFFLLLHRVSLSLSVPVWRSLGREGINISISGKIQSISRFETSYLPTPKGPGSDRQIRAELSIALDYLSIFQTYHCS